MEPKERQPTPSGLLDKAIIACLMLLAFAAPLSIAGTQIAWSFALLFFLIRLAVVRDLPKLRGLDKAMLAFVGLTFISSCFSYEPRVSLSKMVAVLLVTIAYLVAGWTTERRVFRWTVGLALAGGVISALWTFGVLAVGKNLKVVRLSEDSVLRQAGVEEGDTIQLVNGRSVASPADVGAAVVGVSTVPIQIYRHELVIQAVMQVPRDLGSDPTGALGIIEWTRGRDTRAQGFFGHFITYAEAIQLVASLAFGLLVASFGGASLRLRILLGAAVAIGCGALFLTVTRASWLGFAASATVIILLSASRRMVLIAALCAVPIAAVGIYYVQQKRAAGVADVSDASASWRFTVWREAAGVLVSSPRHLALGIGMDSIKTHWQDWHMFDNGYLPIGHMHSDPLQFAFERGIPALVAWIVWMAMYLRLLWRGIRERHLGWLEQGVLLGAFGGCVGFLLSGFVHYNWGDSEVVMIFYLIMGLSLAVLRDGRDTHSIGRNAYIYD